MLARRLVPLALCAVAMLALAGAAEAKGGRPLDLTPSEGPPFDVHPGKDPKGKRAPPVALPEPAPPPEEDPVPPEEPVLEPTPAPVVEPLPVEPDHPAESPSAPVAPPVNQGVALVLPDAEPAPELERSGEAEDAIARATVSDALPVGNLYRAPTLAPSAAAPGGPTPAEEPLLEHATQEARSDDDALSGAAIAAGPRARPSGGGASTTLQESAAVGGWLAWAGAGGLALFGAVLATHRLRTPSATREPTPARAATPPSPPALEPEAPLVTLQVQSKPARTPMAPVSPDDVGGLLANGQAASERGDLEEALAWFERALAVAPGLAVAHFCRGICLAGLDRLDESRRALHLACEAEPADASYRVHFARIALATGRTGDAMDALEVVARALPELSEPMYQDEQLAPLRDHPRFLAILGKL